MDNSQRCPECGAAWTDSTSCADHFDQMAIWEFEDPSLYAVHHLMVLCYHLQHPRLYSPEGLDFGMRLLVDFVEGSLSPMEARRRYGSDFDSGSRKFTVRSTPSSHGAYTHAIEWRMTAGDVVGGGADNYCDNVRAWARLTLEALRASGNLPLHAAE
jgi:hypothetical protein